MRTLTCFLFCLILSGHPVFSGKIPETLSIPEAGTPYPAWVAADQVLTPSGEVDPSLFSLADQFIIKGYLQLPPREGCIRLGQEQELEEVRVGPQKAVRQSLASTARSAGWVFSATVTDRAPGFSGSTPGTLLEVVPQETLKGPQSRGGAHYIFIPVGTFSVGETKICKTDDRYAALPEIGERVLLFIDLFWRNQGQFLWAGGDSGIITINKKGVTSLPRRYIRTEPRFEGGEEGNLLRFVRESIEGERRP